MSGLEKLSLPENRLSKRYRLRPFVPAEGWQLTRFTLALLFSLLALVLAFLTILTPLDWLLLLFGKTESSFAIFVATLVTLSIARSLHSWARDLVDYLFFPDTANFRGRIDAACRTLTQIDTWAGLEDFVVKKLPQQLQVSYMVLETNSELQPAEAIGLPLEMGERFLGTLLIGPKCSGRSFSEVEHQALKQLQEQVSLVLSIIQLTSTRDLAQRTDQLKSNFLSNISHELRTPLNSVINATGLVADGFLGPISVEQAEYLHRAVIGSEHLMNLLDDILDMTKIETGHLTLRLEPVDLATVIEDALSIVRGIIKNKPVELKTDIAENLPSLIADRLRVRQILLNLLSNAGKFTREGFILIKARLENEHVLVSVQDTGIGIARENLSLIFVDYHQVWPDSSGEKLLTRRRHLGTGLGMSITQALVELHGGRIWVESEVGQGSTFTFTLPLSANGAHQWPIERQ